MARVDEIDDPYVGFARVLPVQAARVLLQRALPGDGQGEHQCIEWRMIEAFADQLSGCQQDSGRIR